MADVATPTTTNTVPTLTAEQQNSRLMAAIAFIPFISLLFVVVETYKKDAFIQYYAWLGIAVTVVEIILGAILSVMTLGIGSIFMGPVMLVVTVYGAYMAFNGQKWQVPVISDWVEQQLKTAATPPTVAS